MIYDTPAKADDGMRHVKVFTEDKKKCFIQLIGVDVLDIDKNTGEISFDISGDDNQAKVEAVHAENVQSALQNSQEWFGKEVSEKTIAKAYIKDDVITAERIEATRVFDSKRESFDFDNISPGVKCSVFIEFSGLWFARSHFGPSWNIVQMKIHEEEKNPESEEVVETYPDECMFEDEISK